MNDPQTSPIRLIVTGSNGQMSSRLRALAAADDRFDLLEHAGLRERETPSIDDPDPSESGQLVIDFTSEAGAHHAVSIARRTRSALLVGTTGLSRGILDEIEELSRSTPVMIAPNTSLGAVLLNHCIGGIARALAGQWDVDLIERHHRHKRDAPSGTARQLLETIRKGSGVELAPHQVHCIRAGDIVGDHEVAFRGPQENLIFLHQATNRDVFARGALSAGAWLVRQPAGVFRMEDFLGLADQK